MNSNKFQLTFQVLLQVGYAKAVSPELQPGFVLLKLRIFVGLYSAGPNS